MIDENARRDQRHILGNGNPQSAGEEQPKQHGVPARIQPAFDGVDLDKCRDRKHQMKRSDVIHGLLNAGETIDMLHELLERHFIQHVIGGLGEQFVDQSDGRLAG